MGELNLLEVVNKKEKIYKKAIITFEKLHPLIALAIILKGHPEQREIKISSLFTEERSIGKVFNLDMETLIKILYTLERMGYIKVIRTAGLDIIRVEKEIDYLVAIKEYYSSINN